MSEHIYDYDPAAALESEEAIAVFLADALETGDATYIAKTMGVVARAKGMTHGWRLNDGSISLTGFAPNRHGRCFTLRLT